MAENSEMLNRADDVEKNWMSARGKAELISYLRGNRLSASQSIKAMCYSCNGGYDDGKDDCGVASCPLHPMMPYNPNKKKIRTMSDANRKAAGERMKKARAEKDW